MAGMSRREFVGGAGAAGLGLVAGCGRLPGQAQAPPKVPRIGWLALALTDDPYTQLLREAFYHGLQDRGWTDGQNLTIEIRSAEGRTAALPALAAQLVALGPDVIVAAGGASAAHAAKNATTAIPIVFITVGDPVGQGLVESVARPGENVTGLSLMYPVLGTKRLELLKDTVPAISRVAALWNPASPDNVLELQQVEVAAQALAVRVHAVEVPDPDELERALDRASRERVEAVLTLADASTRSLWPRIADWAATARVPSMFPSRDGADAGGLMAYGPNTREAFRRAAYYVDRILQGAKPADLPVEQPMTFDFVVNMKTAQALGITFPNEILLQVTEVIQ
jgi:putative tryptophan/tyrosine transport system substrate-binding protein